MSTTESKSDELAAEYLERMARGESPSHKEYLAKITTPQAREEFQQILRFAVTPENFPPNKITEGSVLGQYVLEEPVGHGGMGQVYRAVDTQLEREVAVKILPPHREGDRLFRERFDSECKILAHLNHPNIVAVHEAGQISGTRYLVMDLVDGRSLADVVEDLASAAATPTVREFQLKIDRPPQTGRDNLLDENDTYHRSVAKVFREVVKGVSAAHGRGILHRDLKPANVMLAGGGHPVILDFGLSGSIEQSEGTVTEGLFGSPAYLAPEQLSQVRVGNDPRTDIYQLGLILYEMLTLRRAFPGKSISEVTIKINAADYPWPRSLAPLIPRDLEAICLRAMARKPEQRYATADDLLEEINRFLAGEPTLARPPGPGRKLARIVYRNRTLLTVAAALMLAAGGIWWGIGSSPPPSLLDYVAAGDGTQLRQISSGATLKPGEQLTAGLHVTEPMTLWALELRGDSQQEPTTLKPLKFWVAPKDAALAGSEPPAESLSHQVEPGDYLSVLTRVEPPKDSDQRYFGIWLLSSTTNSGRIDTWVKNLDLSPKTYEKALASLASSLQFKTRGDDSPPLSPEEIRAVMALMRSGEVVSADRWAFEELERLPLHFILGN